MDERYKVQTFIFSEQFRRNCSSHDRVKLSTVGEFAKGLIYQAAMVGVNDSETSTGYPITRIMTPEEVVTRALEITCLAFQEFEKEDMVFFAPKLDEFWDGEDAKEKVGF